MAHAGLFESHDGGATFSPAPHASLQCDGNGSGGSIGVGSGSQQGTGEGHLPKFELIGAMIGLGIMQVGVAYLCSPLPTNMCLMLV